VFTLHQSFANRRLRSGLLAGGLTLALLLSACSLSSTQSTINGTPQPSYIFQDSLSSNANGWNVDANCFFKSDGYHINGGFICFAPTSDVADAVATVTVKQLSGDIKTGYGIVFRHPSTGNFYSFFVDSNGKWAFYKSVSGQNDTALVDFEANSAINTGLNSSNTLQVKAVGQNYTFFVNGVQVGQFADTTYTAAGSWGLSGSDGLEVVYTHFSLAKP
jgi:hypothetical protein